MEKVIKTVYSLVYPDTEKVLSKLWKKNPLHLFAKAYEGKQENLHEDFKNTWLKWTSPVLTMNPSLKNFYPTAGSSEAIRESISQYAQKRFMGHKIHVFEGEYEGFSEFAKAYGVTVVKHDRSNFNSLMGINAGERFYISQPSSVDGNVWEGFNEFIKFLEFFNPNVEVMVDLCYVGTVSKDYHIDLSSKLINTVFFSLSKVFGVYYHRIGGVFSKYEMPGLYGNRWFKNVFSLTFGMELMNRYAVQELPRKYQSVKDSVIYKINKENGSDFKSSDVFMLAHDNLSSAYSKQFDRTVNSSRICITPLLDDEIRAQKGLLGWIKEVFSAKS